MSEPAVDAWRNEDWARRVAGLSAAERGRRLAAVAVLLEAEDDISDVHYSELVILRDALREPNPSAGGDRED